MGIVGCTTKTQWQSCDTLPLGHEECRLLTATNIYFVTGTSLVNSRSFSDGSHTASIPKDLSEISLDARDASQDTLNTAVSGDFVYAAQPFIGTPVHARRLFRKWLEKVWFCSQAD